MKSKNVFRIWLWANLMIAFGAFIFTFSQGESLKEGAGTYLLFLGIGFLFSVPSLIILMIFENFYPKKNEGNNIVPYILIILLINILYAIVYFTFNRFYNSEGIYFFILTTICGIAALFIEYNIAKKNTNKFAKEEIKIDEIQ